MHDNKRYRYLIFFYSNSASFVASVVVIILLLKEKLLREDWLFKVMNITIVLNLLGLLLAYMAGSRMRLESSGYFIAFVIAALGIASAFAGLFCHNQNDSISSSPVIAVVHRSQPSQGGQRKQPAGAGGAGARPQRVRCPLTRHRSARG